MKKLILLTILLLMTTNTYADSTTEKKEERTAKSPLDKGVYSLGGSISYRNVDSNGGNNSNMFQFIPSGRYFILDNIAVGGSLTYEDSSGDFDIKSYGIGPNLRFYLPNETANPFFEAGYSYLKTEFDGLAISSNTTTHDYSIGLGLDYFISKNVSIEPIIKYSWRDYKYNDDYGIDGDTKTLYVGIGISLFIF